jgi:hypothetical protein
VVRRALLVNVPTLCGVYNSWKKPLTVRFDPRLKADHISGVQNSGKPSAISRPNPCRGHWPLVAICSAAFWPAAVFNPPRCSFTYVMPAETNLLRRVRFAVAHHILTWCSEKQFNHQRPTHCPGGLACSFVFDHGTDSSASEREPRFTSGKMGLDSLLHRMVACGFTDSE